MAGDAAGTTTYSVAVTDGDGGSATAANGFSLTVNGAVIATPAVASTSLLVNATAGFSVAIGMVASTTTVATSLNPSGFGQSVTFTATVGGTAATPTFSVFLQAGGPIPFAPATSRVFVRFKDAGGGLHGSTSVAIETE